MASTFDEIFIRKIYRPIKAKHKYDRVIDVGAHYGLFTIYMMLNFEVSEIQLFEPNPNTFDILRKNIESSEFGTKAQLSPMAVCRKSGIVQLEIPDDCATSVATSVRSESRSGVGNGACSRIDVPAISIEEAIGGKACDFLKLDAEGVEYEIFASSSIRPDNVFEIAAEIHDTDIRKNEFAEMIESMRSRGYRVFTNERREIFASSDIQADNSKRGGCLLHFV